jgi:putative PIN family toxin of toxin-antitoxin system
MNALVLDTNILLDLWVFEDPRTEALQAQLENQSMAWLATSPMRDEFERVLSYPHLARRQAMRQLTPQILLARFDRWHTPAAIAPRAPWVCKDPDDQKFIDLACAHQAHLLSKDFEVLRMAKRLLKSGATVSAQWLGSGDDAGGGVLGGEQPDEGLQGVRHAGGAHLSAIP